jgi:hypothetical protein
VDIPLLPGLRPFRLAAVSHKPPTLLTAVSGLSHNCSCSSMYARHGPHRKRLLLLRVLSESVRVTYGLAVYRQSISFGDSPPETHDQRFLCGHSPYVISSLSRGWISRLQLLLALASGVVLRSEPRGTHDRIYGLRFEARLPGGPGPCTYIPKEQGGPVIPPDTGFPPCSLVAGETTCPQSCSLATAIELSSVYTAVTWQLVWHFWVITLVSSERA